VKRLAAEAVDVDKAARAELGDIGGVLRWSSGDKNGMSGLPTFPSCSWTDPILQEMAKDQIRESPRVRRVLRPMTKNLSSIGRYLYGFWYQIVGGKDSNTFIV
jgi:hypothetical protein